MKSTVYRDKLIFLIRFKLLSILKSVIYLIYWRLLGIQIGKKVRLKRLYVLWPNKVSIGNNCILEHNIVFKHDGPWSQGRSIIIKNDVFIGNNCEFNINCGITIHPYSNISSGCKFIDHNHGIKAGELIGPQRSESASIVIEEDVWLGVNVIVLKGVTIGKGAVIGAGATVTKSIPPNEIWTGIPATKKGERKL